MRHGRQKLRLGLVRRLDLEKSEDNVSRKVGALALFSEAEGTVATRGCSLLFCAISARKNDGKAPNT